jgi:hypothetical protein
VRDLIDDLGLNNLEDKVPGDVQDRIPDAQDLPDQPTPETLLDFLLTP